MSTAVRPALRNSLRGVMSSVFDRLFVEEADSVPFVFTVQTTGVDELFTIPCQNVGVFNAVVDWGDGGATSTITTYDDVDLAHTYASADTHTITITGQFPNIYFNNAGDKLKVRTVTGLGSVGWSSLYKAFWGCTGMTSFVAGDCDTSGVTNLGRTFQGCTSLTSIDVTGLDTSNVTIWGLSFSYLRNAGLTSITGIDTLDTAKATSMADMFSASTGLTTLDVSNFNTALVTNMTSMFEECSGLTTLDVSNFNTALVTNMTSMFKECSGLTTLDVSSFDTAKVTDMSEMFRECYDLTTLDVSNFNTALVTDMRIMFYNCISMTSITGIDGFNIEALDAIADLNSFLLNTSITTAQYDAILIAWDAQNPFDSMTPNFGTNTYTGGGAAATARANLISTDSWVITDGGTA